MLNSIPKEESDIHYNHHPYIIKEKNGVDDSSLCCCTILGSILHVCLSSISQI